jgi:DNA-binding NtrC family response regulator
MKKILIIDDEEVIRELLGSSLKKKGFDVLTATDGIDGIAKAKAFNPELVLCDILMPGLSGIEVLKEIKQYNQAIIVIMLTGFGTMDSAIECLRLGAYDHIGKPFELQKLLRLIKEALKIRSPDAQENSDY